MKRKGVCYDVGRAYSRVRFPKLVDGHYDKEVLLQIYRHALVAKVNKQCGILEDRELSRKIEDNALLVLTF